MIIIVNYCVFVGFFCLVLVNEWRWVYFLVVMNEMLVSSRGLVGDGELILICF